MVLSPRDMVNTEDGPVPRWQQYAQLTQNVLLYTWYANAGSKQVLWFYAIWEIFNRIFQNALHDLHTEFSSIFYISSQNLLTAFLLEFRFLVGM